MENKSPSIPRGYHVHLRDCNWFLYQSVLSVHNMIKYVQYVLFFSELWHMIFIFLEPSHNRISQKLIVTNFLYTDTDSDDQIALQIGTIGGPAGYTKGILLYIFICYK